MDRLVRNLKLIIPVILIIEGFVIVAFPPTIAAHNPVIRLIALMMAIIGFCYLLLYFFTRKTALGKHTAAGGKTGADSAGGPDAEDNPKGDTKGANS